MTYYGLLTKHTDVKISSIEEAGDASLEALKPAVDKFMDNVRDRLWDDIKFYLIGDCASNVRTAIAQECEEIITALLLGDAETIQKTGIISEYTFRKLPEIRLAIFNACADDLQKTIISNLEAENKRLEEELKWARRR